MSENKLNKYLVNPVDFLNDNWNQYFCQTCKGGGVYFDQFSLERNCAVCYGRGEKAFSPPRVQMEMQSLHLDIYGLFYIEGLFYQFDNGNVTLFFLYDDLIWRDNRNSQDTSCFFSSLSKAKKILAKVS
jgi:hypothetical protein